MPLLQPQEVVDSFKATCASLDMQLKCLGAPYWYNRWYAEGLLVFRVYGREHSIEVFGEIEYTYDRKNKLLTVKNIRGKLKGIYKEDDAWKPDGVGTALFAQVLLLYPDVETVIGEGLSNDNIADTPSDTPAFKIATKFGFVLDTNNPTIYE